MIIKDIKNSFQRSSMLSRLIYINIFIFILTELLGVVFFLFSVSSFNINTLLALPASFKALFYKPWTPLTYMFTHNGFIHLIINLLWLHFGGTIFLKYLSNKQVFSTYLLGGLAGGLFYIISFNYFPVFKETFLMSTAIGSSASVLAILICIATYAPNYRVNIPFVGNIKLKYIAIVTVLLDLILIPDGNAGGHIAHLGGAFYGFIFAKTLLKGKDISKGFDKLMDYLVSSIKPQSKMKTVYKKPVSDDQWRANKAQTQNEINLILDKISKSGYDSLNKVEKDILFRESKK